MKSKMARCGSEQQYGLATRPPLDRQSGAQSGQPVGPAPDLRVGPQSGQRDGPPLNFGRVPQPGQLSGPAVFGLVFLPFALGHYLSSLMRTVNAILAPQLIEALALTPTTGLDEQRLLLRVRAGAAAGRHGARRLRSAQGAAADVDGGRRRRAGLFGRP